MREVLQYLIAAMRYLSNTYYYIQRSFTALQGKPVVDASPRPASIFFANIHTLHGQLVCVNDNVFNIFCKTITK